MIINGIIFSASLEEILQEWQLQLHHNGINLLNKTDDGPSNIQVQCPYHKNGQERKPSAGIKKSDGTFHCFGCGETHTLQEVIADTFGHHDLTGSWGWNWLLRNFVSVQVEERKDVALDFHRNNKSNSNINCNFVSEEELDSYREYHSYMWKRKLTPEIVELFDIGYDKETECLTFPQRDINGNTLFIARRSVKTKFFNYPTDVDKPVYGLYELKHWNETEYPSKAFPTEIIICESMLDALTVWTFGKYAVALNGLGTDKQFETLKKLPVRKFVLATDMDEAGRKARQRIKKALSNHLVSEYIWNVNLAKDINDMSKEMFDNLEEIF